MESCLRVQITTPANIFVLIRETLRRNWFFFRIELNYCVRVSCIELTLDSWHEHPILNGILHINKFIYQQICYQLICSELLPFPIPQKHFMNANKFSLLITIMSNCNCIFVRCTYMRYICWKEYTEIINVIQHPKMTSLNVHIWTCTPQQSRFFTAQCHIGNRVAHLENGVKIWLWKKKFGKSPI